MVSEEGIKSAVPDVFALRSGLVTRRAERSDGTLGPFRALRWIGEGRRPSLWVSLVGWRCGCRGCGGLSAEGGSLPVMLPGRTQKTLLGALKV